MVACVFQINVIHVNSHLAILFDKCCTQVVSTKLNGNKMPSQIYSTLGSRGYFFLIDTDGSRQSRVNEEKNNLWSQEYATSFPCEKSVQNLNWVTDWIPLCPQGINNIIMALIGYIEQLDMGVSNRWPSSTCELISHMEMRLRTPVTRGYFFAR